MLGHPEHSTLSFEVENSFTVPIEAWVKFTKELSPKKIKIAVFQMAHNISPSPYGFTSTFCQHFWKFIMNDLKALFDDFHTGRYFYNEL